MMIRYDESRSGKTPLGRSRGNCPTPFLRMRVDRLFEPEEECKKKLESKQETFCLGSYMRQHGNGCGPPSKWMMGERLVFAWWFAVCPIRRELLRRAGNHSIASRKCRHEIGLDQPRAGKHWNERAP